MKTTTQIAAHVRALHFGGNWTDVNLKDTLSDVDWQQATIKINSFNTIAALVYHINYFIDAVIPVLQGRNLDASDKFSFNHPPIESQEDWDNLMYKIWTDAETLAILIEKLPDSTLWEDFWEDKYGNYYKNLQGIVEHSHYHLGQIVLVKKMILQETKN
jgi:hypothetical protein